MEHSETTRYLFVGTSAGLAGIEGQVSAAGMDERVQVVGVVLPGGRVEAGDLVWGAWRDLVEVLDERRGEFDEVMLSMPQALGVPLGSAIKALQKAGVVWRWVPTLSDQLAGRVRVPAVGGDANPVGGLDPLELLGREPAELDEEAIRGVLENKTVMITGAGGSIGSELARMVCRFGPKKLVLVERAENSLFEIDREIERLWPEVKRSAVLHDITDAASTITMLASHSPKVIFHAAAHKHVPMMEEHPIQAVENNFYGTRSIAEAAAKMGSKNRGGVERFVMISTDKAVNPTSVMGATKRLAELYIQYLGSMSATKFSMVRFGNVLGSACSVVPIWTKQLARGGPITVTDERMTRYFMTIPEAAGLVIQSAAYVGRSSPAGEAGGGGEVFLLDMGEPIRIAELAERFVRTNGLEPGRDIEIAFTGVRPGEKLFEELAYDGEGMLPTPHESIRIWRTAEPDAQKMSRVIATFDRLRACADRDGHHWQLASPEAIIAALEEAIPEMRRSVSGKPAIKIAAGVMGGKVMPKSA